MEEFLKDKKKTGICVVTVIVIIVAGFMYCSYGFKELRKNDTETIFIDDGNYEEHESNDVKKTGNKEEGQKESAVNNKIETKEKTITVEIKGEVKKPDVYILKENSIVRDLINEAGGLTENADITNINRAKQLQNHELVYISNKNEAAQNVPIPEAVQNSAASSSSIQTLININCATAEELKTLKGIGDSKAKSIIEYREKNGGFKSIEDIKNVGGIGEKMFENIKDNITV